MADDATTLFLKFLYFLTKINGLLPITITFDPLAASSSGNDVLYSTLYTMVTLFCTLFVQSTVIDFVGIINNPKLTIVLVFFAQVIASVLRLGVIYISQILNYKNLSRFVNRSVQIHAMFNADIKHKTFLDQKLSNWCRYKFVSMILQVLLMLVPSIGFIIIIKSTDRFAILLVSFLFILYTHMVLILSTGIYFAGMVVIGQFYRNLNRQLIGLQNRFSVAGCRMQELHHLSDECDRLIAIYRCITSHASDFVKYQRSFAIISLAQYFVILLAEVYNTLKNLKIKFAPRLSVHSAFAS